jgi:hypothetical protein
VALTLRGVTRADPAAYAAFEALLRVLDGGMSGRVYQALCVRDGLAYSVDAEIVDHGDATLLQFSSEVAPANLDRVVGDVLGVLSALARRPVPAGELDRVREGYRFSLLAQLDDAAAMAEWFGAAALFQEPLLPSARLALMSRVSARDVMLAARRVAQAAGLALAVVGPVSRAQLRALRRTGLHARRAESGRERQVEERGQAIRNGQPGQCRHQRRVAPRAVAHDEVALGREARDEGPVPRQQVEPVARREAVEVDPGRRP